MFERIKGYLDSSGAGDWAIAFAVIVTALLSFAFGRLSALEEARPAVSVGTAEMRGSTTPVIVPGGGVLASKNGTVYYFPWCAAALRIGIAQQVWFDDKAAAERAGYRAAKNCKGLE